MASYASLRFTPPSLKILVLILTASVLGLSGISYVMAPTAKRAFHKASIGCLLKPSDSCLPEKTLPSVVSIETSSGAGSGVIIDAEGLIITNAHVVPGIKDVEIRLSDDRVLEGEVVAYHQDGIDLALIQIKNPPTNLRQIRFGRSRDLRIGQQGIAIGNPVGLDHTVSKGSISQLESVNDYMQLDISISPGSSGGPFIDQNGQLVGINTAIVNSQEGSTGIGLAIPVDEVRDFLHAYHQGDIPQPPSREPQMVRLNGELIQDELAYEKSRQLDDGSLCNYYQFAGSAGQKVEIIMSSTSDVDPYLLLRSPGGDVSKSDDDGGGLNALLTGTLPQTGVYTLCANTARKGQIGNYSLMMKAK